jgi:hypothetical protein
VPGGVEPELAVELVRVLGPEEETEALHLGVPRCDPDQERPHAVAPMVGIDEDVAEPGECGTVGVTHRQNPAWDPPAQYRPRSREWSIAFAVVCRGRARAH